MKGVDKLSTLIGFDRELYALRSPLPAEELLVGVMLTPQHFHPSIQA